MADLKRRQEYDREERVDELEKGVVEVVRDPERPTCPRCGWHNTRPSHTRTFLDSVLRTVSIRAFRCRSCGNRFRVRQRTSKK